MINTGRLIFKQRFTAVGRPTVNHDVFVIRISLGQCRLQRRAEPFSVIIIDGDHRNLWHHTGGLIQLLPDLFFSFSHISRVRFQRLCVQSQR